MALIEGSSERNSHGTDMAPLGLEVETSNPIFFLFYGIYFTPIIPNRILNKTYKHPNMKKQDKSIYLVINKIHHHL